MPSFRPQATKPLCAHKGHCPTCQASVPKNVYPRPILEEQARQLLTDLKGGVKAHAEGIDEVNLDLLQQLTPTEARELKHIWRDRGLGWPTYSKIIVIVSTIRDQLRWRARDT
jgi:hypothetical protein